MKEWFIPFLCILLLLSCVQQEDWSFDQIHSEKKEFCSTRLAFFNPDRVNGIDLEMVNTEKGVKVFLNIHSTPLPHDCKLYITAGEKSYPLTTQRLQGGQRLLLSAEEIPLLIELLQTHQEIVLRLPGYRSIIPTKRFAAQYKKLLHPFPYEIPFQLSF